MPAGEALTVIVGAGLTVTLMLAIAKQPLSPITEYEYDYLSRPTKVTLPDGAISQYRYGSTVHLSASYEKWLRGLQCQTDGVSPLPCAVDVQLATETRKPDDPTETARQSVLVRDFVGQTIRTLDAANVDSAAHSNNFFFQHFYLFAQLSHNNKIIINDHVKHCIA